jgi:hypothetical protein
MATDKSEPRVGLIFRIAFLVIVTLVCIRAALNAYFDQIASAEEHRKFGEVAPTALINARADEEKRLTGGPLPIDKAMQEMVAKGRKDMSSEVAPAASARDIAPLQGWQKMPFEVPPAMTAAPPVESAAPAATSPDGGAPKPDAGAPAAPKKPATKKNP